VENDEKIGATVMLKPDCNLIFNEFDRPDNRGLNSPSQMHEMSIAIKIIEVASGALPEDTEGIVVEKINVQIGRLSAIVPQSLNMCFDVARQDTPMSGATLEIEEIPIIGECNSCGVETTIERPPFKCGQCGAEDLELISGRELLVTSIEVADQVAA